MKFTETQVTKMKENLNKIVKYIEEEVLPYIDYQYETPKFGPLEKWGRFDENSGFRFSIKLNNYSRNINFCHADVPFSVEEIPEKYLLTFIEYWQEAKTAFNTELQLQKKNNDIINNFQI